MTSTTLRLLGAHEIRTQIGEISRQRVYQLAKRPDFPRPVAELAQGKVWLAEEVEAWLEARRVRLDTPRQPGEP